MDQDVLPVILALHHLVAEKEVACIVPGLELLQEQRVAHEFDFIFVTGGRLHAGECKAGRELGEKDLRTARAAAGLGVNHFYFASPEGFRGATLAMVETFRDEVSDLLSTPT